MSVMIQIRNVPDEVHRRAKIRAAECGLTLSELALQALRRELDRPSAAELAARVRSLDPVPEAPPAGVLVREDRDAR